MTTPQLKSLPGPNKLFGGSTIFEAVGLKGFMSALILSSILDDITFQVA